MERDLITKAVEYYTLVGEKNVNEIAKRLHPNVEFYGPMARLNGREAVLEATKNFINAVTSLNIQAKFGAGNQTMIVYTVDMPGVAKDFPGASLMTFHDGQIVRIQLFYDASLMLKKRDEIFSNYTETS